MLCTISIGNYALVQGLFVRQLASGKMVVRIGRKLFKGTPVITKKAT